MATFWDVAYRVGDEIMKALDDLIEESEDRFEGGDDKSPGRKGAQNNNSGGNTTADDDESLATGDRDDASCSVDDELNDSSRVVCASSPSAEHRSSASNRTRGVMACEEESGMLQQPPGPPPASSAPPRTTKIPKIRLSAMEHLKIQRFVDSALLQIAIVQLPSVDAVEELVSYYNGCDDLATRCSHSPSLTHLLKRTEDDSELNDEEIDFNEVLIKALPKLFLQLNWVHAGQEQVQRIHAGASVMVPWSQVYELPKLLHPTAQPLSAPALRRWSVWIGHQLLSDSSKFAINYAVGLPMDAPVAPPHPNHRTIGKCITPTHWQLLLRGCGASMDHLHLMMDSNANKTYADATFEMRLNGCDHPCLILVKTASLDVVGCVVPQLPPKGQRVVVTDTNPGTLMYFTFSPTYRTFVVDRADPSNFFVISHDSDGGIGVFAKCPQRTDGGDSTAANSPATSEQHLTPQSQDQSQKHRSGRSNKSHHRSHSKNSEHETTNDTSNFLVHEFGVAFHVAANQQKARIATIGSASVPAPFGFNIATDHEENVHLRGVWVFDLVKESGGAPSSSAKKATTAKKKDSSANAMAAKTGSSEEFVVVTADDARVDSPFSTTGDTSHEKTSSGKKKKKKKDNKFVTPPTGGGGDDEDSEDFDMCATDQ